MNERNAPQAHDHSDGCCSREEHEQKFGKEEAFRDPHRAEQARVVREHGGGLAELDGPEQEERLARGKRDAECATKHGMTDNRSLHEKRQHEGSGEPSSEQRPSFHSNR